MSIHSLTKKPCASRILGHPHHNISRSVPKRHYCHDFSLENCENIEKGIERLNDQFLKQKKCVNEVTLPRKGLEIHSVRNLLTVVAKRHPTLPALGAVNATAIFTTAKVFLKPDIPKLRALEPKLKAIGQFWGYQMQNIPLNDEKNIEELSRHILEIYQNNTVVLTLNKSAKVIFQPKTDPKTSAPDLRDRTVTFLGPTPERIKAPKEEL